MPHPAPSRVPQPATAWRFRLQPPQTLAQPPGQPLVLLAEADGTVVELVPIEGAQGSGQLLRCRVAFVVPTEVIAHRRATGQYVQPAMEQGVMTLEVRLPDALPSEVLLCLRPETITLHCDGALVDEDWPVSPRRGSGQVQVVAPAVVSGLQVGEDNAVPTCTQAARQRWLPDARPLGNYWRPAGVNTSAGDTMVCVRNDELHLFWLHDRRWHQSKWGIGAHQFDHASTTDLKTWRELPRAVGIDEQWITVGTGSCVHDGERFHLFWHNHGERFGAPEGTFVSTSGDGERFACEAGFQRQDLIQPGVWREADGWRMLCHTRLYSSPDLRAWTLRDAQFITMPAGVSDECPCVFTHDGRSWLLTGREGCWTWRDGERPRAIHDQAPYDGLMVPMVANWQGRLILAAWLHDDAAAVGQRYVWGGTLAFRELIPQGERFAMRWVPELIPAGGDWHPALASTALADGATATVALPNGRIHVRLQVAAAGDLALVVGGDAAGRDGTEIRIEPSTRRLVAARAVAGPFTGRAHHPPSRGQDFALPGIDGLEALRQIDVIIWPDRGGVVIDVQLDTGRTIIARHAGASQGGMVLATRGGKAQVAVETRILA